MARSAQVYILLAALVVSTLCLAQAPVPGTFSTTPVEPYGGLLVTAPSMSLGNGITPPVVSSQPTVYVAMPQSATDTSLPPSLAPASAVGVAEGAPVATVIPAESAPSNADMVYATSGTSLSGGSREFHSLGELARMLRHNGQQPAEHVYTNSDLAQLNMPVVAEPDGSQTSSPQSSQASPAQQPQQRPHQYSVPVGTPPPTDVVPNEQPRPHSGSPFEPKVRSSEPGTENQQAAARIPKAATPLPLLGIAGGALLALGLISRRQRVDARKS